MKTFGLYILLFLASMLITFNVWKISTNEEMIKVIMATQIAYIMYRLVKEEDKS